MTHDWQTILAIDFEPQAANAFALNFPDTRVECGRVDELAGLLTEGMADVLLAGPPCQPFSTAGKGKGHEDARDCFPDAIDAIHRVMPRQFLIENVPGLLSSKHRGYLGRIMAAMEGAGYEVAARELDAVNYGAPQFRTRVFFWGIRRDVFNAGARHRWPAPTHAWPWPEPGGMFGGELLPAVTCGQALFGMHDEHMQTLRYAAAAQEINLLQPDLHGDPLQGKLPASTHKARVRSGGGSQDHISPVVPAVWINQKPCGSSRGSESTQQRPEELDGPVQQLPRRGARVRGQDSVQDLRETGVRKGALQRALHPAAEIRESNDVQGENQERSGDSQDEKFVYECVGAPGERGTHLGDGLFLQSHADPTQSVDIPSPALRIGGDGHDGCCLRLEAHGNNKGRRMDVAEPAPAMRNCLPGCSDILIEIIGAGSNPHYTGDERTDGLLSAAPWKRKGDLWVRRLSVLECARLQSMPDDYRWPEGMTKTAGYKIVGNGVNCAIAAAMGRALAAADPRSRTVVDLFCGGGLGAMGWHGRYWTL